MVPECKADTIDCSNVPCNEDKVFVVKGYLKDIHATKLGIRWYEPFENKAEDYLRSRTADTVPGVSMSSLSKINNLGLGPNVVRWKGPGICTRHMAGKYYYAALNQIEPFSGGLVGCAVGRNSDNAISCIYYKKG